MKLWKCLWLVAVSSPALASQITYLEEPKQALSALYKSIASAEKTIDISYYEVQACHTVTKVLVRALKERLLEKPQLKIRFLFDAHSMTEAENIFFPAFLKKSGIQAKIFNNSYKFLPQYNYRNHAKYLVADNRLITGGRNLTDNYYGLRAGEINWIDGDVLIESAANSQQARKHFQVIWENNHTYNPESDTQKSLASALTGCLRWGDREEALLNFLKQQHSKVLFESKAALCNQVDFKADDMTFSTVAFDWESQGQIGGGFEKLNQERILKKPSVRALTQFLTPAKKLTLVNHIYIPFGKVDEILKTKRSAGVSISLYTNYYRNTDYIFEDVHNYYAAEDSHGSQRSHMISTVPRPDLDWELSPSGIRYSNHAKLYIVNSNDVAVTSMNLDPRSYMHNIESGAFIRNCPAMAKHIEASYATRMTSGLTSKEKAGIERRMKGHLEPSTRPSGQQSLSWFLTQFL
jgi:putative cardiolipin synthase